MIAVATLASSSSTSGTTTTFVVWILGVGFRRAFLEVIVLAVHFLVLPGVLDLFRLLIFLIVFIIVDHLGRGFLDVLPSMLVAASENSTLLRLLLGILLVRAELLSLVAMLLVDIIIRFLL